ncbi:DUF2971 domain-containing protein [Streptococcus salivarius]|uniref:DUF2971 domain-containing protein n=1 Tax=Streptococcus salivarius TaxID=1304 RepID=UPI00321BDFDF|nr:DUF2971 domain-containing protein [Streptococcus salivarius]
MSSDSNQEFFEKYEKVRKEYLENSNSEKVASEYLSLLCNLALKQEDKETLKAITTIGGTVYDNHSDSEENANNYLWILRCLALKQEDEESLKDTADKASTVYTNHSDSELKEIADNYSIILFKLASKQEGEESLKDTADKASTVYDSHSESEKVTNNYVWILYYLALKQDDEQGLKDTADKAFTVYQNHLESEDVADNYLCILFYLASKQDDEQSLKDTADKAAAVYEKHSKSDENADNYLWILRFLSSKQGNEKSLKDTADKAFTVYQNHLKSEKVANDYLWILYDLAKKQDDEQGVKDTADKASTVYEKHSESEKISERYLWILYYLASKQRNEKSLKDTADKAFTVYEEYSQSEDFVYLYGSILVNQIRVNNNISELNEISNKLDDLLSIHTKVRLDFVIDMISNLISYLNDKINRGEIIEQDQVKKLVDRFQNKLHGIQSIQKSNNGMLSDLLKKYESDSIATEHILNVYNLVLKIKFELAVKEFPKNGFGHYTTARTLHIHLNQQENILNKSKYEIISKSRLYNVEYMNDPEEGKILDKYLLQQKENDFNNFLEPSPWFLMCLTTAIDNLAMWSQYGANAEGVFLELKSDSFQLAHSHEDLGLLSKKRDSINSDEENNWENNLPEQDSEKDYLFQICYLDDNKLKDGELVVVSSKGTDDGDFNLTDKQIRNVTSFLEELKDKVDKVYKLGNPRLFNDVDKLVEEIRYLFKSSSYEYEKELRVLRYATIESTPIEANEATANKSTSKDPKVTELIGIQYDSDTLAKPYLERKDPIQIKRVIFGPKFSRPEYVTPLIRLVDKDIEFTTSEKKFK